MAPATTGSARHLGDHREYALIFLCKSGQIRRRRFQFVAEWSFSLTVFAVAARTARHILRLLQVKLLCPTGSIEPDYQPANHQPFRHVHIVCCLWALHGIFTSPTFARESPETTEILEGLSLPIIRLAFASRCQTRGPSSHPIAICQTAVQSVTV